MTGFKEALLTRVLCVTDPDRFLTILKYTTEAGGKREIARMVYGLELPSPESVNWTRGGSSCGATTSFSNSPARASPTDSTPPRSCGGPKTSPEGNGQLDQGSVDLGHVRPPPGNLPRLRSRTGIRGGKRRPRPARPAIPTIRSPDSPSADPTAVPWDPTRFWTGSANCPRRPASHGLRSTICATWRHHHHHRRRVPDRGVQEAAALHPVADREHLQPPHPAGSTRSRRHHRPDPHPSREGQHTHGPAAGLAATATRPHPRPARSPPPSPLPRAPAFSATANQTGSGVRPHCDHTGSGRTKGRPLRSERTASDLLRAWSGRQDLNLRPLDPQSSALPSCATSRCAVDLGFPPARRHMQNITPRRGVRMHRFPVAGRMAG
ncbi:hypothetical protein OV450_2467 [Actinobacteria bacterium OV450]|nr:hypothetical protein OV450_2467 [Actinobacteria bacterium OV450]